MSNLLNSKLLEDVIKEYYSLREEDYIFFLSKSRKKKITTESFVIRFSPSNFKHLIGCQKLDDKVFTKHSVELTETLYNDFKSGNLNNNTDFSSILSSLKFDEIKSRLELIKDFKSLIISPETNIYQHNSNSTQSIPTTIVYDYLIHIKDTNCPDNCYLFCRQNRASYILEPVSIFKTNKKYHIGHLLWNIDGFYTSKKHYEKTHENLYPKYPEGYTN